MNLSSFLKRASLRNNRGVLIEREELFARGAIDVDIEMNVVQFQRRTKEQEIPRQE